MPLVVTSASGLNGDGYGALLAFDLWAMLLESSAVMTGSRTHAG